MKQNDTSPRTPLKERIFERIETENVCPRSRWFFRSRECFVWALWLLSVVIGALAIAVSVFVVSHHQYALYEATHENFLTFLVDTLPYLWIVVFGIMVFVAVYNLRHTSRGYRYPLPYILASSIILSFAGGSALQFFGFGYTIDSILGKQMQAYMSMEKQEARMWQAPEEGRLLGRQVFVTVSPTTTVVFADTTGQRWRLNVTELFDRDRALLASEERVRVFGELTDRDAKIFHACGVFSWMMRREVTRAEMSHERTMFLEQLAEQKRRAAERLERYEAAAMSSGETAPPESRCAQLAVAQRIEYRNAD